MEINLNEIIKEFLYEHVCMNEDDRKQSADENVRWRKLHKAELSRFHVVEIRIAVIFT
jgi:hypothetical protein